MKNKNLNIAIIGGGAAGLASAFVLSEFGAQVTLYEKSDRIGKPILVTGNGRCNISNRNLKVEEYYNADFVKESLRILPPEAIHSVFQSWGLSLAEESAGRLYPATFKATSVLDVLRFGLDERGVDIKTSCEVENISFHEKEQTVSIYGYNQTDNCAIKPQRFDAVILAAGGANNENIIPEDISYSIPKPCLLPLKLHGLPFRSLNNIRARANIIAGKHCESGEIMFRDYGISGVAAFNISRYVEIDEDIFIDFLPWWSIDQGIQAFNQLVERYPERSSQDICAGIFLPRLAQALLKKSGVNPREPLAEDKISYMVAYMKHIPLTVLGFGDPKQAQVRRGGCLVDGFSSATMQSFKYQQLYVVGEALDIDGPCGGYNLHWAWTSALLAACSILNIDPVQLPGTKEVVNYFKQS